MPEARIEQAISQAAADVLEKMFFTGFAGEAEEAAAGEQIAVRLPFEGSRRGELMLRISAGAARTMAADFLGLEEDARDEQVHEVVRELANMICGDALSHVEAGALRLGVPRIVPAADCIPPAGACRRCFDLGAGTLALAVMIGDGLDG